MKIRINKRHIQEQEKINVNKNIINEDSSNTNMESSSNDDGFDQLAQSAYIDKYKKQMIATQLIMPSQCGSQVKLAAAPIELRDLMQDIPTGPSEKQENNRGMIYDPTKTFNASPDYAYECFQNILKLSFGDKKKLNRKKTKDNVKNGPSESLSNYEKYNSLNELDAAKAAGVYGTAISAGSKIGAVVGTAYGAGSAGMLASAGTFLAAAAPAIVSLYGLGFGGGLLMSDVKQGGVEDDSKIHNSHEETEDRSNDQSDKMIKNQDTIAAIETYIQQITEAATGILTSIAAGKTENATLLETTINDYIAASDQQVKTYLEKNEGIMKKITEDNLAKTKKELESLKNVAELPAKITKRILENPKNFGFGSDTALKICSDIAALATDPDNNNILNKYLQCAKQKDGEGMVKLYNKRNEKTAPIKNIGESVLSNYYKVLNEDISEDEMESLKPQDLTEYYKKIKSNISNLIIPMFPIQGADKLQLVQDAKKRMEDLTKAATDEINTKIEQVCRVTNSGNADNSDLSQKVKGFISKHPMKAATLKNLWARHEDDLKGRMQARLQTMTDFKSVGHITGWAADLCKRVYPEVIARMFTYRYALQLLVNNDFYHFDSNLESAAKEQFDLNKDDIKNMVHYRVLYAIYEHDKAYTIDGEHMLQKDENTELGYSIDLSKSVYLLFLVYKLVGKNQFLARTKDGYINGIATIKALYQNKTIESFVNNIELLCRVGKIDLDDNVSLFNSFSEPQELTNQAKKTIKSTYDYLVNLKLVNQNEADNKKTLTYILEEKDGRDLVRKQLNIEQLTNYYQEYQRTHKKELLNKIYTELNPSNPGNALNLQLTKDTEGLGLNSFIQKIQEVKDQFDYYSLILYVYFALQLGHHDNVISNISEICRIVKNSLFLLSTNILNAGNETPSNMEYLINYSNAYQSKQFENLIGTLKTTDNGQINKEQIDNLYTVYESVDSSLFNNFQTYCKNYGEAYRDTDFDSNSDNGKLLKDFSKYIDKDIDISKIILGGKITTIDQLLSNNIDDLQFGNNSTETINKLVNNINYLVVYTLVKYDKENGSSLSGYYNILHDKLLKIETFKKLIKDPNSVYKSMSDAAKKMAIENCSNFLEGDTDPFINQMINNIKDSKDLNDFKKKLQSIKITNDDLDKFKKFQNDSSNNFYKAWGYFRSIGVI